MVLFAMDEVSVVGFSMDVIFSKNGLLRALKSLKIKYLIALAAYLFNPVSPTLYAGSV